MITLFSEKIIKWASPNLLILTKKTAAILRLIKMILKVAMEKNCKNKTLNKCNYYNNKCK